MRAAQPLYLRLLAEAQAHGTGASHTARKGGAASPDNLAAPLHSRGDFYFSPCVRRDQRGMKSPHPSNASPAWTTRAIRTHVGGRSFCRRRLAELIRLGFAGRERDMSVVR